MLTRTDVRDRLRVSLATVTGWIESGDLAATDVRRSNEGRPQWRIDETDLRRFLEKRKVNTLQKKRRDGRQKGPVVENLV